MDPNLYEAATKGNHLLFRYLAENHPDRLRQLGRPNRNTVLHIAANNDNRSFVELIRFNCPDLIEKKNSKGETALHIAARAGHISVVQFLIDWARNFIGSISREAGDNGENDLNFLLRVPNRDGNTALHEAVLSRNPKDMVELLVSADPESMSIVNKNGESPLFLAVDRDLLPTVVKMLEVIPQDTSESIYRFYRGPNGQTPMHTVVAKAAVAKVADAKVHEDILQILLQEKKELIKVTDYDGRTPLHYAASSGYLNGVTLLVINDASVAYQRDKDGLSPIHMASIQGHTNIVEHMLKYVLDLEQILNKEDQNALHVAAKSGKQNVVKSMLKLPAFSMLLNETDSQGNTPLHLATIHWHPKIVTILLRDKRVDKRRMNSEGLTALDIAEKYIDTFHSFRKRLTLAALKSANAPRGGLPPVIEGNSEPNRTDSIEFYRDRINTLVLVAALITTVTFAAGFTMPGGFNNDGPRQGLATMLTKLEFQIFLICNTIAMYSSIISAITLIWAQLGDIDLLVIALRMSLMLLAISLTMMAFAFAAGVYLVPLWSKYPVLRDICYCVLLVLLLTLAALRTAKAPKGQHRPAIGGNSQSNRRRGFTVKFYRERINTLVLLGALITTVTFAAGFTMSGGYNNEGPSKGMATMLTKVGFQLFLICNTIAMYSSIIATVTLILAQFGDIDLLVAALRMSLLLLAIALTMMAMAISAAVDLVVSILL
ncbi:hypothetical protein HHK36_023667 [Tetracentron sinense]|uniref:PGG domain-containing protein n=1 Tax=Tetracentron sinense TaxID=13715 RepID=A0A835D5L1_TETSI|nr:hypothetical protein HHK36_023667 [Tetracentron sinense]